jgi:ABC-type nitrate/sulfonate/bicarbonate transport system permease component
MRVRALQLASVGAALALWEASVRAGLADPLFVPAPTAVAAALRRVLGEVLPALGQTLGIALVAYVLSVGLGVGLGLLIGARRFLADVLSPFLVAAYGLPKILVLPWIVLTLGTGVTPALVYGTLHGCFPVLLMVIGGVRDVDRTWLTVARAFGARPWQLYSRVVLPAIVPAVLAGMRLGIVFALLGVLVVEMFAGVRGMGYELAAFANAFQAPELFAATLLVSAVSVAIVLALDVLGERLSRWR